MIIRINILYEASMDDYKKIYKTIMNSKIKFRSKV